MGGFDSMITEKTTNVLIESAWFDPATIRSMAKRHGMHTDASHRFERGADWGITPMACDRVAELILETAGGELVGERIDAVARKVERPPIALRRSEVKRNLGIDIEPAEIERILRFGCGVRQFHRQRWRQTGGETSASRFPPGGSTWSARSTCWKSWRASTATTSFPTRCRRSPAR